MPYCNKVNDYNDKTLKVQKLVNLANKFDLMFKNSFRKLKL